MVSRRTPGSPAEHSPRTRFELRGMLRSVGSAPVSFQQSEPELGLPLDASSDPSLA